MGGGSIRWNPYIYAGANPANYTDPSGMCFWDACVAEGVIVGLLVGALIGGTVSGGIEAGAQLLQYGEVRDWRRVGFSALEGGVLGAISGGMGGLAGGMVRATARSAAAWTTGQIATAGAIGFTADFAIGVAWDARVHNMSFGDAIVSNIIGNMIGMGISYAGGYAFGRGARGRSSLGEIDGQRIIAEDPTTGAILLEDGTVLGRGGGGNEFYNPDTDSPHFVRIDPENPSRPHPDWSIDTSTFDASSATATRNGGLRDHRQFWEQWIALDERLGRSTLNERNLRVIEAEFAPTVNEQWLRYFPEHAEWMGGRIEHHHVSQGIYAIPLPEHLHRHENFGIWHP